LPEIDHCAEAIRLNGILSAILTGDSIQSARFGEDEVRYFKADTGGLRRQIAYHEGRCSGRRTHFAIRGRFTRPY
jgi:hypothetical protein